MCIGGSERTRSLRLTSQLHPTELPFSFRIPTLIMAIVSKIHTGLEENTGTRVWMDVQQIAGGQQIFTAIVKALSQSDVMVAMFSSSYVDSEMTLRENSLAFSHKLPLIPVMLDNEISKRWITDLPPEFQWYYASSHNLYLRAVDDKGKFRPEVITEIADARKRLLGQSWNTFPVYVHFTGSRSGKDA